MIRDTDPVRFVKRIRIALESGSVVVDTYSQLEWRVWRWVRVYVCLTKFDLPNARLLLTLGPFSEQPIPDLEE